MLAGEELSLRVLIAAAVIIVAVMLITLNQASRSARPAPMPEVAETLAREVADLTGETLTWTGGGVTGDVTYKVVRSNAGDPAFPARSSA
jgi:hypothetical protein